MWVFSLLWEIITIGSNRSTADVGFPGYSLPIVVVRSVGTKVSS